MTEIPHRITAVIFAAPETIRVAVGIAGANINLTSITLEFAWKGDWDFRDVFVIST